MERKLLLIVNPVAGMMKVKSTLFNITNTFCKAEYFVVTQITQYREHATEIVKQYGASFDLIVCCGGDGTLNEVIEGILEANIKTPLGYIPSGSTNDFANTLKLSTKPIKAVTDIITGIEHKLDIGIFGKRHFSYIASFGAFTAASYKTAQEVKNTIGHMAYILEGIKELPTIQPYHMTFKTDDAVYEGDYIFGAITNSTSVAGLVKLRNNLVDLCDGLFEVILVKSPQNINQLNKILTSIMTSDFKNDMFEFFKASTLSVISNKALSWTLDGEHVPNVKEIAINNLPGAVTLIK